MIDEESLQSIANEIGISRERVRQKVERAKKQLAAKLIEHRQLVACMQRPLGVKAYWVDSIVIPTLKSCLVNAAEYCKGLGWLSVSSSMEDN